MEIIACPCCHAMDYDLWAEESGFAVVRCNACRLLYVNPRPSVDYIGDAVTSGEHRLSGKAINVRSRRSSSKISHYKSQFRSVLSDVILAGKPVRWVDVGCGYGELIEALIEILPKGSEIKGVEPMEHKALSARSRGLDVHLGYLENEQFEADFISNIDVFSHIPDYHSFLQIVVSNLAPRGEFIMETGNLADLARVEEMPNELGVPDHLVFGGRDSFRIYFDRAGLEVVSCKEIRFDTSIQMAKNLIKILLGRNARVSMPYTSAYRQLIMRTRSAKA